MRWSGPEIEERGEGDGSQATHARGAHRHAVWGHECEVALDFITPGRPVENVLVESFNGRLRDERLNE